MDITNISLKNRVLRNNNPLLPKNIRALIVGKSNCGKTTLLLNLLLKPGWLDYNNLLVFGNSLHQLEYQIIKKGFEKGLSKDQVYSIFQNQNVLEEKNYSALQAIEDFDGPLTNEINAQFFDSCELVPDPSSLNPQKKNLLILDDCFLGKQNKAEAYYTRGRHNNCDTIYISQNYFKLPRQTIRENANFIILFPQDSRNINHLHADHCPYIPIEEFRELCTKVWKNKHNFVTIDLTTDYDKGKFRQNFQTFYIPDSVSH